MPKAFERAHDPGKYRVLFNAGTQDELEGVERQEAGLATVRLLWFRREIVRCDYRGDRLGQE